MSFDTEVQKILRREGGYVNNPADRGGETNFGISSRANPDVDVKNLTREAAAALYKTRYWDAAQVDSFPEHMQAAVFDAAVQHGAGTAAKMGRAAGGDLEKFNEARMGIYASLLKDPSQQQFKKGWMNRMAEFGGARAVAQGGNSGGASARSRPIDPDLAWHTSAYDVDQALRARQSGRSGPRDALGEAAVDYIATLTEAAGGDTASVYDTYRGQTAAAAERLVRSGEGVDGYTGIDQEYFDNVVSDQTTLDKEQQQSTLREQYNYLWREGSATGALVSSFEEAYTGSDTPDPNLRYLDHMHEWEKGRTGREIEELRKLGRGRFNQEMIDHTIATQDQRRKDGQVLRGVGGLQTFGLSLAAGTIGDPLGVLAGFGAYKGFAALGLASRSALVAGNTGRAFVYGGAEAAVGELGVTAMIDAFGKQQSAADYAMAAGFGFALGTPFVALDVKGARIERAARGELADLSKRISDTAAARVVRFHDAARKELGEEASPEQVASRAQALEQEEVREHYERIYSDLPDEDMLAPRPVEEDVEVPPSALSEAARKGSDSNADAALGDFYRYREGERSWMESRELRDGITDAELSGNASDAVRAVTRDTGASTPLRALAARLADLSDELGLKYVDNTELSRQQTGWQGVYFRDSHEMSVRVARPEVIVHEALHGATSNLIAAPKASLTPEMRARVKRLDEIRFHVNRLVNSMDLDSLDPELASLLRNRRGPVSNTQEFVTYAMTNKGFQGYLATLPAPKGTPFSDAWDWFKDLVADMLGLKPGERSALDEAIEATGDLLDAVEADVPAARSAIFTEMERVSGIANREAASDAAIRPGAAVERFAPTALLQSKAEVDAVAKKYGLDVGMADNVERALAAEMYARAEVVLEKHPINEKMLKPLLSVVGWEATSTRMLLSKNPLMRATAVMLMENPEGAAGRQVTASLIASTRLRAYRDAAEPMYDSMLELYAAGKGHGRIAALVKHQIKKDFDKELSREMNSRWMKNGPTTENNAVLAAADALDRGYKLMAGEMQLAGVLGARRIDVGRSGYFTRSLRGDRVSALTGEERRIVTKVLSQEFQTTAGFDKAFADQLAVKYLEIGVDKATKGWNVSLDLRSPDTADTLRDALTALKFGEEDIAKHVGRFSRGGASFTKGRIDMDMAATHTMADGSEFRLGDLFEDDMLSLYKNYARRASGEVALSQFGIMGTPGAKMLRNALAKAGGEWKGPQKTHNAELEAYDQFMAEMLGQPFGTRLGAVADNFRALTSSAFLGGMGFTQLAESGNGLHAVGAAGVMGQLSSMPRLLGEVRRIGAGKPVENSLLNSIEVFNGVIGSDQYRLVGLRDAGDRPEVYGQDKLGMFSLAARGTSHAVRVMSMQRAIEAVQVRGFSEQIVRKSMRYIKEGIEDAALADMGITPDLRAALAKELDKITVWEGRELVGLDLNKMEDRLAARAFAFTVERGASQIIQKTYPGEVGKWAHSDHLLLLTQFRSYPLVATQKQWRRVSFSQGGAKAVGFIIGSASIVLPIYLARTALQGVGKDQEWWDKKLSPMELGRAMSRYTSGLGLTSDVIDALSPVLGLDPYAGRSGATGAIPAISYANQLGQAVTDKDPNAFYRSLPGNNIPPVQAGMQWLFSDE